MERMNLIKVNIHTKGNIPWINKIGPLYGWELSPALFRLLSQDRRVEIYLVEDDPKKPLVKKVVEVKVEPEEDLFYVEPEKIKEETKEELPSVEKQWIPEEKVNEALAEPIKPVEVIVAEKEEFKLPNFLEETIATEDDKIDEAIAAALEELPEIDDDELEFDEYKEDEIINYESSRIYTSEELANMTKADMKEILKERGHINDEYTGRYHDNVDVLIRKVLETQ